MEPAFDATTFSKNRERLMDHDVAAAFFFAIRQQASDLMSREHFSVDGTLIDAWASMKSFRDARTTRHVRYEISQRIRMRIETVFGWLKSVGGLRRTRYRGRRKTQFAAYLAGAAYNLLRVARLRECAV